MPILLFAAITLLIGGATFYATDDMYYRRIADGYVVVDSPVPLAAAGTSATGILSADGGLGNKNNKTGDSEWTTEYKY